MCCHNTEPWNSVIQKVETSDSFHKKQPTWLFLATLAKNLHPSIERDCR
jgi:hypothetical protein